MAKRKNHQTIDGLRERIKQIKRLPDVKDVKEGPIRPCRTPGPVILKFDGFVTTGLKLEAKGYSSVQDLFVITFSKGKIPEGLNQLLTPG